MNVFLCGEADLEFQNFLHIILFLGLLEFLIVFFIINQNIISIKSLLLGFLRPLSLPLKLGVPVHSKEKRKNPSSCWLNKSK